MEEIGGQSKKTPTVVAACIVCNGGKILLIKRTKPPFVGLLSMPGGKVEFGEHPVAAALRETKEETGLECKFDKMLGVFSEVLELPDGGKKHFIIFVCTLVAPSLQVKPSEEGELKWIDEVQWGGIENEMIPSDWRIVKDFYFEKNSAMEIREIKMCETLKEGKICYEMEECTSP